MTLKIDFVDFWDGFDKNNNYFMDTLYHMYGKEHIEISPNPDIIFFSCFGFKNLRYDCIKIFFTGENIVPDFNLCDYALGTHEIIFEDRYFRLPFYMLYSDACKRSLKRNSYDDNFYLNRKFCSYVISNSFGATERREMINLLSQYKAVDSGGKWNNNVGGAVVDKLQFIKNYKFTLCFENSSAQGYTTEKLVEGFAGGGIPIYWGNPGIRNEFNPKAFIDCSRFSSMEESVEYIRILNENDEQYLSMVHEPIFIKGEQENYSQIQNNLETFLDAALSKSVGNGRRINRIYIGKKYTDRMKFFSGAFEIYRFLERYEGYFANRKNIKGEKNEMCELWMWS